MMMLNSSQRVLLRSHGTLLARIFIGALFFLAGVNKIFNFEGTAGFIGSMGLPVPEVLAILAIVVEVAGGAMIILGWKIGLASAALIVFTAVASVIFHGPSSWSDQVQQIMFNKNIAIIGGLFYILAYGPGEGWSLGKKRGPSGE